MPTIGDVIDRTLREWLTPPTESPARFEVNDTGGISASDLSVITDASWLSPEEQDLIGPGTIIEIDRELMLVTGVTGTAPALTLTIRRGMLGTTAATHADDSLIILQPDFGRQAVFEAVSDAIDDLWPDLWLVKTAIVATSSGYWEVDADVEEVLSARVGVGSQWAMLDPGEVELLTNFDLASSGKALQWGGGSPSGSALITYKAKPARPAAESDTFATLNISDSWQKPIVVGAAASLLRATDVGTVTVEFITEALEVEGFPPGMGENLSNALLRYQEYLIQRRAEAQNLVSPPTRVIERML